MMVSILVVLLKNIKTMRKYFVIILKIFICVYMSNILSAVGFKLVFQLLKNLVGCWTVVLL